MSNDEPIRLSYEELNSEENIRREQEMTASKSVSKQRTIGNAPTGSGASSLKEALFLAIAGLMGGLISFLLNKGLSKMLPDMSTTTSNISFTLIMAASIATLISMVDAISTRSSKKVFMALGLALPISLIAGLIFGAIANAYYSNAQEDLFARAFDLMQNQQFTAEEAGAWLQSHNHLPRGLAWLFVGISGGITAGLVSKSAKRLAVTSVGGAVGGFIGGFVFDYMPGEAIAQAAGMSITGLLVGAGMAVLEQATKNRWIEVTQGGLAGKQFIIYKQDLVIGSSPQADITLIKDPGIPPLALRLSYSGNNTNAVALQPGAIVIDGREDSTWSLQSGSVIQIADTVLVFREKSGNSVPVGGINRAL